MLTSDSPVRSSRPSPLRKRMATPDRDGDVVMGDAPSTPMAPPPPQPHGPAGSSNSTSVMTSDSVLIPPSPATPKQDFNVFNNLSQALPPLGLFQAPAPTPAPTSQHLPPQIQTRSKTREPAADRTGAGVKKLAPKAKDVAQKVANVVTASAKVASDGTAGDKGPFRFMDLPGGMCASPYANA